MPLPRQPGQQPIERFPITTPRVDIPDQQLDDLADRHRPAAELLGQQRRLPIRQIGVPAPATLSILPHDQRR
jgi:hypothetical protein